MSLFQVESLDGKSVVVAIQTGRVLDPAFQVYPGSELGEKALNESFEWGNSYQLNYLTIVGDIVLAGFFIYFYRDYRKIKKSEM